MLPEILTYIKEVASSVAAEFDICHTGWEAVMSRVQLALNVDNLAEAVTFYSKLFNTEPAKLKDGYANFAIAEPPLKLVLIENPGKGGSLNHLGVEVESSDKRHAEIARLAGEGMFTHEAV